MNATSVKVFLSHHPKDIGLATFVASAIKAGGVDVSFVSNLSPGTNIAKAIRNDLIASTAVVILATPNSVTTQNLAFETGIAMAWSKPIYVLYDGLEASELPSFTSTFQVFPVSQIEDATRRIIASSEKLTDADQSAIIEAYQELGVPLDQVVFEFSQLTALTNLVATKVNKAINGQSIARVLMALRKASKLPRLRTPAITSPA